MSYQSKLQVGDIKVGDILAVLLKDQPGLLFNAVRVTEIDLPYVKTVHESGETDTFDDKAGWNFFLVDRPKPKLPTKLGSVVKADERLWVLCDPHDNLKWRSTRDDWETDVFFDHVDWELVD